LAGFSEAVIGAFGRHTGALTHGDGGKSIIWKGTVSGPQNTLFPSVSVNK
jgi:hypothetical protein